MTTKTYGIEIETNPDYWDCECDEWYIWSKEVPFCLICGAHQEDQPDSRQDEVEEVLNAKSKLRSRLVAEPQSDLDI